MVTKDELKKISGPAAMHAIGHIAANVSFAAVAISLTHTVKTLEPAFNVLLGQLILGQATPLPVIASLVRHPAPPATRKQPKTTEAVQTVCNDLDRWLNTEL